MALTEQQRSEIYGNLADAVGQQGAEFLMAQQPPGGWEQLATKRDLANLDVKTQASFIETNAKMDVGFAGVEVKIGELNSQIKDTNAEAKGVRAEMATGFARLTARRGREIWAFVVAVVAVAIVDRGAVYLASISFGA